MLRGNEGRNENGRKAGVRWEETRLAPINCDSFLSRSKMMNHDDDDDDDDDDDEENDTDKQDRIHQHHTSE